MGVTAAAVVGRASLDMLGAEGDGIDERAVRRWLGKLRVLRVLDSGVGEAVPSGGALRDGRAEASSEEEDEVG